jgi:hypothetical protein
MYQNRCEYKETSILKDCKLDTLTDTASLKVIDILLTVSTDDSEKFPISVDNFDIT